MVRALLIASLLLLCGQAEAKVYFFAELSKPAFYSGEQFGVNFIVYSADDMLEVEVVKFPEFRDFWSENLILRQGPIQLLPAFMQSLSFPRAGLPTKKMPNAELADQRRAVVGSYVVSSLVGKADARIEPMKLLIRRRIGRDVQEVELLSEIPNYKIVPLPPIPASQAGIPFLRAVGNFQLRFDSNQVLYRENEPAVLRAHLQGDGNLPEVNDLLLSFPEGIEVLAKRSSTQGGGNFVIKTFEYTLSIQGKEERELLPQRLLYFQPDTKTYETLATPTVHFTYSPPPPVPEAPKLPLFEPELHYSIFVDLAENIWFRSSQSIIALFFFVIFFRRRVIAWRSALRANTSLNVKRAWKAALHKRENLDEFVQMSFELLMSTIPKDKASNPFTSREQLARLEKILEPQLIHRLRTTLHAYEAARFSRERKLPVSPEDFQKDVEFLLKKIV
jgi:hypothetical protein